MSILLKLKPIINKKNGQINTSFQRKKLPQNILDAIKKQPGAVKRIIVEYKGYE